LLREWRNSVPEPKQEPRTPAAEQVAALQKMLDEQHERNLTMYKEMEEQIKDLQTENDDLVRNEAEAREEQNKALLEMDKTRTDAEEKVREAEDKIRAAEAERDKMSATLEADKAARREFEAKLEFVDGAIRGLQSDFKEFAATIRLLFEQTGVSGETKQAAGQDTKAAKQAEVAKKEPKAAPKAKPRPETEAGPKAEQEAKVEAGTGGRAERRIRQPKARNKGSFF
jgi:chromosome segregation ATPase